MVCSMSQSRLTSPDIRSILSFIARQDTTIDRVRVATPISDHSLVIFTLRAKKPATAVQGVTNRAWRRLSMEDFASDLAASKLSNTNVDEMAQLYRTVTTELLDKHCPVANVRWRARPKTPWFDAECRSEREEGQPALASQGRGEQGRHEETVAYFSRCSRRRRPRRP